MERKFHFHRSAETKLLDYISIRCTESTTRILCCPITVPKFQTILGAIIGIKHFCRIKRYL